MTAETKTIPMFPVSADEVRHVVSFSGGAGSWAAAKRVAERVPREQLTLLFADTLIEDQDTYRVLLEGAANVLGLPRPELLTKAVLDLPELSTDDPHCVERKECLAIVRSAAAWQIPGLVWIAEGRHPWEVFEDRRFIGNSSVDPCSRILKREFMDAWRDSNCTPDACVMYVGIDWSEKHRLARMLPLVAPWRYEAPLCEPPYMTKCGVLDWMRSECIEPSRGYALGFPHDNCGGFCCKAGIAHFAQLYRVRRSVFDWHEWWEQRLRSQVGDYSMLTDRRGGTKKPLTLSALRERIESGEQFGSEEWGGCGCALAG